MPRIIAGVLLGIAILYACLCAVLFLFQRSLIYYPQPGSDAGDPLVTRLKTDAGDVLVTTRPADGPGALVYFGGNAEDVALSLPDLERAFPGRSLYLLHYRGYGGSAGSPSETALLSDAQTLLRRVHSMHKDVIVMGRSLGSGIAVRLAALNQVELLILVTPFDSMVKVAAAHFPFVPVGLLLRDRYDSFKYAPAVTAPTLLLAAGEDEIIPRDSTERLRSSFGRARVRYVVVPGMGHNTISTSPEYTNLLRDDVP